MGTAFSLSINLEDERLHEEDAVTTFSLKMEDDVAAGLRNIFFDFRCGLCFYVKSVLEK